MRSILPFSIVLSLSSFLIITRTHAASLMDVVRTNAGLSQLNAELSTHPDLIELLESTTASLTLLAPNNDAWSTPDGALLQQKFAQRDAWQLHWNGVLTYLLWNEVRTSRQIYQGLQQTTAWRDETVNVQINRDGIFFQSPSSAPVQLVRPDITVDNGVLHILNGFPLPQFFSQSLWDVVLQLEAEALAPYTRMRDLLIMTEVEGFLQNSTAMTFLAAPDEAFTDPIFANETLDLESAAAILQNHMIPQVLPPALFVADSQVKTLYGQTLTITESEEGGIRIGSANVTQETASLLAGNGLTHIVSSLLIPPNLAGTSLMDKLTEQAKTIHRSTNSYNSSTPYSNVLQNYTVFIAENSTLPNSTQIPSDWIRHRRRFVAHQTISGMILTESQLRTTLASASVTGQFLGTEIPVEVDTLLSQEITFLLDNETEQVLVEQSLPQKVIVTAFDVILADNGAVNFISNPLVPPFWTTSLLDIMPTYDELSTLQALIVTHGLEDVFSAYNQTLLAPTNAAFIRRGTEGLTPEILEDTLLYHLLTNVVSTDKLPPDGSRRFMTALGRSITVSRVGDTSLQFNQQATSVSMNILHNQGIMHIVDTVLVAPLPNETDAPTTLPTIAPTGNTFADPTVIPLSTPPVESSQGNRAVSFRVARALALFSGWAV